MFLIVLNHLPITYFKILASIYKFKNFWSEQVSLFFLECILISGMADKKKYCQSVQFWRRYHVIDREMTRSSEINLESIIHFNSLNTKVAIIQTSHWICSANQLTGFYMITTLAFNWVNVILVYSQLLPRKIRPFPYSRNGTSVDVFYAGCH